MGTADYVLRADSIRPHPGGAIIRVGLPWYRSLPWASVAAVAVEVDGRPAEVISVDGVAVPDLVRREDYWFLQHRADVLVRMDEPLASDPAEILVRVDLRIPGPTKPDGSPMDYAAEVERAVAAS